MSTDFSAHFDGRAIIPDEPLSLSIGEKLRVRVESLDAQPGQFADLARFAADLPDSPGDLSLQHDHYLYGVPKK